MTPFTPAELATWPARLHTSQGPVSPAGGSRLETERVSESGRRLASRKVPCVAVTCRLLGWYKYCRGAPVNHLGNAKCKCSYTTHALESLAGPQAHLAASARAGAPGITARAGQWAWKAKQEGDVSLTPVGCLPQQAQDFPVWTAGPPASHWPRVLGRRCLTSSAPATCMGQGAGHGQAAVRSEGQMRRHGACWTPSRAQTPRSAGPACPCKAGQGLSLSRRQGPLPDCCSGLASLDAPWSPCPLAPQLSVL